VLDLSGRCVDGLSRRDLRLYTSAEATLRAGVVALPIVHGQRVVAFLRERAVDVWTDPSETLLRIDPHVFNDSSDLERLFVGLDEYRRRFGSNALQTG
jgi:selenocysteine lyase/cysteine desulfurase